MSIGATGGYDEFEHQHVTLAIDDDTGSGTGSNVNVNNAHSIEPLGGLGRDEIAELVALHERLFIWGEDAVANGHFEGGFEVSSDTQAHFLGPAGLGSDFGDELVRNQDAVQSGTDTITADTMDIDVLRTIVWAGGSFSGSATALEGRELIEYRDEFGTGPEFDRHDNINYHLQFYVDDDMGFTIWLNHHYVWDVFER